MTNQIKEQIKQVNQLLEAGEPTNISVDSYSGYVGYKPQYIIDAMNEVFDIGSWGFEEVINEIEATKTGDGLAVAQVKVWFKDITFQPTGWGQSRVTKGDIGDAKKGAQTDAIKKALSYFSIGNRAYQGLLKEGGTPSKQQQKPQQPRPIVQPATNAPKAVQPMPAPSQKQSPTISQDAFKALYGRGKEQGLFATPAEFAEYVREALGLDAPIEFRSRMLTEDEEKDIQDSYRMRALQSAQARAKVAVAAQAS